MNTTAKQGGKKFCLQLQSLMLPSSGVTEQESFPAVFSNYLPWLFSARSFLSCDLFGKFFSGVLFPCKPRIKKNKTLNPLMSWDELHASSDRIIMEKKKTKQANKKHLNYFLWFKFNFSALPVTKIVLTFCVLIEGPIHGVIWSFITKNNF